MCPRLSPWHEVIEPCILHLDVIPRRLVSMHDYRSLFDMDIRRGMPAVVIELFLFSETIQGIHRSEVDPFLSDSGGSITLFF